MDNVLVGPYPRDLFLVVDSRSPFHSNESFIGKSSSQPFLSPNSESFVSFIERMRFFTNNKYKIPGMKTNPSVRSDADLDSLSDEGHLCSVPVNSKVDASQGIFSRSIKDSP
eukprot:TRINITY_DN20199_c0_g1_i1.p6 TRINITY_DN20199_c0_g1~~TRINITY_DN20199_c0_g1_i1.p6  ORF type:complete len:112 (-),score=14.32 TRINITY_DN20199_c0_g1_i1:354-689(-)